MYVLDTNICIELMAGDRRVIEHMAALERVRVSVSAVTIAELAYGAARCAKPDYELAQVNRLVRNFVVLPVDSAVAMQYGAVKWHLASRGELLEDNDLFIAATALSRGFTLVTHDRGFSPIPDLPLEDWLE